MANFNLNKVILGGRLTDDPELKQTPGGISVTSFGMAVNRKFRNAEGRFDTDFINVTAWRSTAEFICRFFHKGSSLCVCGSLQTHSYKDRDGKSRYITEVLAEEVSFVDAKNDGRNDECREPLSPAEANVAPVGASEAFEAIKDEDTPF